MATTKEVLVIGAGIAGCAVALALSKRGVTVTIVTSSFDQRAYHAPFIQSEFLEEKVRSLQSAEKEQLSCSRAMLQLMSYARKSVEELLEPHYLVDRNGNIDIHRCLQEQLKQQDNIEWMTDCSLVELLTLDKHSTVKGDVYKKQTCLGARLYNHRSHCLENFLAKEVILATGGATSLFPYSTHPITANGSGLSIANQAGARLINIDHIQFHPLGLFEKHKPCFPLPLELLYEGGKLRTLKTIFHYSPSIDELTEELYDKLQHTDTESLWLDLTMLDPIALKDRFPSVDAYCLNHGYNIVKDLLPVTPVARYTGGGIAVDRLGQTSLQRLHALGEVCCTGLSYDFGDEAMGVLEGLTWALSCAENIEQHLSKFIYYFPELKASEDRLSHEGSVLLEDWQLLKQLMWNYVGIKRDRSRLTKGYVLLDQLKRTITNNCERNSIDRIHFLNSINTGLLIAYAALDKCASK